MIGKQALYELIGATAYDRDGERLGRVDTVFVDDATEEGTFVTVTTGLFGSRASFVPLVDADLRDGELHVAYPRERVQDAPNVDADDHLDPAQELALYRYYDILAVSGDAAPAPPASSETAAPGGDELPTGADLVADQGIDPMLDGPQVSAEDRLRLRRLGDPVPNADDPRAERGEA